MAREQWGTKLGFMLAAMGSAVGLGNIWRFSFVAGNNGGGAFLLLYLGCVFLIGIPLLLTEVSIGRKAKSDVVGSYQKLAPKTPWFFTGFFGIFSAFLILSFYAVVAGWSLYYFFHYITGDFFQAPGEGGFGAVFGGFISQGWQPLFWTALFMAMVIFIVVSGVKRGIETANKIFMPLLALLLIVLAVFSLSLDGAMEGLKFLFQPDWSAFSKPSIYVQALCDFFSLSLGMGALLTYGSYLSDDKKLPGAAIGIGLMDTFFAVISGLVIFPAVFAFSIDPSSGPPLVFITLPTIFEQMPLGGIVGLIFFFALSLAALSSAISILEVPTAYFMRLFNWTRKKSSITVGSIMFFLGIFVSLGFGVWSGVTPIGDRNILDSMDYIASNILLPLGGLSMALFVGWYFRKSTALKAVDLKDDLFGGVWYGIVKFIVPVVILIIFVSSL